MIHIHSKVYQLNAHTIKVLNSSNLDIEPHKVIVLGVMSAGPSTSSEAAKALTAMHLGRHACNEEE